MRAASLPGPEHVEVADLLLERASGDLAALRILGADQSQADHVVGFHAQQAVEKSLKAALVMLEVEIPRTHELAYVLSLLEDAGVDLPKEVAGVESLTPWAGGLRYDEVAPRIDREDVMALAEAAFSWARCLVDAAG
ncbi:MAG: HEPN domain-containing protein [Solirubrobacteraceae bacterium]